MSANSFMLIRIFGALTQNWAWGNRRDTVHEQMSLYLLWTRYFSIIWWCSLSHFHNYWLACRSEQRAFHV